jgi:hypothetical protein
VEVCTWQRSATFCGIVLRSSFPFGTVFVLTPIITDHGGHVGFVSGAIPFSPHFWAEDLIADWLADRLS